MDLGSLWRRFSGQAADDPGAPADVGGGDAGAADEGAFAASARAAIASRPSRPAWRDLAPIPSTVRAHPLVAPTVSFSNGLAGHQPAPLALETLGHDRPADAPAGVVTGLFVGHSPHTPVQDETGGTSRVSVRGRSPHPAEPAEAAAVDPPRLAGSPVSAPDGLASPPLQATGGAASSPIAPTQRRVVARSVASTAAPAPMTIAPSATVAPTGMIGRPAVAGSAAPAARPGPADTSAPLGAAASPSLMVSASPVEPLASVAGAAARRNLGQTRRLRIGPAIGPGALDAGEPDGPVDLASAPMDASGRAPSGADTIDARSVAGRQATKADETSGLRAIGDASAAPPTVARSAAAPDAIDAPADTPGSLAGAQGDVSMSSGLGRPVPARLIPSAGPVERGPLVGRLEVTRGSRRGQSAAGANRAAPPTSAAQGSTPRSAVQDALAALAGGAAIPAASGSGRSLGSDVAASTAAGVQGAAVSAQRSSNDAARGAGEPGWGLDGGSPTTLNALATTPPVARSVGGPSSAGWATSTTSAPGSWSRPIRQLSATGARTIDGLRSAAGHSPIGTVVGRSAPTTSSPVATETPAGTVWRSVAGRDEEASGGPDGGDVATALDTIQRLEAGEAPAAPSPVAGVATPTVLRVDGGDGGSGGSAGAGQSDKELDELARKLFPRLQLKLRGELLIDRERIGALVDLGR